MSTDSTPPNINSLEDYEEHIEDQISDLRTLANKARSESDDPAATVEIGQARDIAERCEKLLQEELTGIEGLQDEIRYYENETDLDRETISFKIADAFVDGDLGAELSKEERVEAAIRIAVALLTEGVVAAPLEGIGDVSLETNDDGTDYIRVYYNGPIRSAGGTGQALSVLVADHVRQNLGISKFKPREEEVQRYKEEIKLYDDTNGLQYLPKDKEIVTIIDNCPIMLDGMGTTDRETSAYRDLERIHTNQARGGVCLVAAEGMAQKAPKLQRIVEDIEMEGWSWLTKLPTVNIDDEDDEEESGDGEEEDQEDVDFNDYTTTEYIDTEIINQDEPIFEESTKYMKKLPAGRPVYSSPNEEGGFRLRYGRARNTGIASSGFHPATMIAMDDFIAPGMQQKTERPGKATGTAPVDTIQGPTVKLYDGTVTQLTSEEQARDLHEQIDQIIDVGEILVNYGEFLENNHPIGPSPYVPEWWIQDLEHAGMPTEHLDVDQIDFETARKLSNKWDIPLHPNHTYLWNDHTPEQYHQLSEAFQGDPEPSTEEGYDFTIPYTEEVATILETLLCPHKQADSYGVIHLKADDYDRLDYFTDATLDVDTGEYTTALNCVNDAIEETVLPRATLRIGTRMGRPEKTDIRKLKGDIQSLYPIGDLDGQRRRITEAAKNTEGSDRNIETGRADYDGKGTTTVQLNNRMCSNCNSQTWRVRCPDCDNRTELIAKCTQCNSVVSHEKHEEDCETGGCGGTYYIATNHTLNVNTEFHNALKNLGLHPTQVNSPKAVKGLSSVNKVPEPLEKGLLRSKYGLYPFRDGTIRYDMVDLPLTSFRVDEVIGLDLAKASQLGYTEDLDGNPLESEDQTLELYPQDVIISEDAGEYLLEVSQYLDELLESYYDMDPYYEAEEPEDLIGELMMGLAPHTSASVTARLIGFTDSKAQLGHPLFHAAKRRNCFHPDTELSYKLNGEWNRTTIEELVETHLTEDADDSYDDGSIVQDIADHPEIEELKVPSMTDDGLRTLENVTHLSKHAPEEELIKIEADDGTELKVTKDHKFPVKSTSDDELIVQKEAHRLAEGDTLFDYNEDLRETVQQFKEVDMLEEMLQNDHTVPLDDVMIRGMDKEQVYDLLREEIKPHWDGTFYKMSSSCDYLGIDKKTLDNYLRRNSIPVSLFKNLYSDKEDTVKTIIEKIPSDVELGMNSDSVQSPRMITVDEELATLIGYFTAEGYTRELKDSRVDGRHNGSTHIDFSATEDEAREFIQRVLEKKFNVTNPFTGDENRITASGQMVRQFFLNVLDAGNAACRKEVPELIKSGSERIKRAYVSGFISGDGYLDTQNNTIGLVTTSKKLVSGLENLLEEFNYSYWERTEDPVSLHEKFPDYYDEDTDKMSKMCYYVELHKEAGKDLRKNFGMQLNRKNGKVRQEFQTKEITNVETTSGVENTYNLTVEFVNRLEANSTIVEQCDGDEDSFMFVLDGFLNFSSQYLPDSIGRRSVTKDTQVYVREGGVELQRRIDELFNEYNSTYAERSDGWEVSSVPDSLEVISFDTESGEVSYESPSKIMRHRNDKDVYEITTTQGTSVKMTGDHGIFVHRDGEIVDYDARDLDAGDHIIVPSDLSVSANIEAELGVQDLIGDIGYEVVKSVTEIDYGDEYVYDFEVPETQNFLVGDRPVFAHNTMDAPLVMTSVIDPTEVDDEAHMVDTVAKYDRSFYLQSWDVVGPKDVDVEVIEDILDNTRDIHHTTETTDINAGPYHSAYSILEGMDNKVDSQLDLARRTRGVSEKTVASKVVASHFFPDIRGNMRAFAQQDFRCTDCETKYRRLPLTGECEECADGGNLIFTVHEGMVRKYMQPTLDIAEKYEMEEYVLQQLDQMEDELDSIFKMDTEEQTGIEDFL